MSSPNIVRLVSPLPTGLPFCFKIAKNLIVGAVLLDDVDHVLDAIVRAIGKL